MVGPDLAGVGARYDRISLVQWIQDPQALYKTRGRKPINAGFAEMPATGLSETDAQAIADYLIGAGGKE